MDFIDVLTLAIILIVVASTVAFVLWLASVPGKLARARDHAQADALTAAGWPSLLTLLTTWPLVLRWHISVTCGMAQEPVRAGCLRSCNKCPSVSGGTSGAGKSPPERGRKSAPHRVRSKLS